MNIQQREALESLISRQLTQAEIDEIDPFLTENNRNDVKIAEIISRNLTVVKETEIGIGTILAALGENGGTFLDTLVSIGEVNRNVYWTMDLIKRGVLRIDMQATQVGMQQLAIAFPSIADQINTLIDLCYVPYSVPVDRVSYVLNEAEGRLQM